MKIGYYPGCTLKTKATNLEQTALAALRVLGVEYLELDRWNCCGAVFSLADDDLIHQVAPVRDLIRAREAGCDTLVTLCSQCYNTLARANLLMREDEEKRDTLNRFMDEEPDYDGEVEVVHYLQLLRDEVGWERLRQAVKVPLDGLKVAPFYGCTLVRPTEVAIDAGDETILEDFLAALGAEAVPFVAAPRVLRLLPDAGPSRGGRAARRQGARCGQPIGGGRAGAELPAVRVQPRHPPGRGARAVRGADSRCRPSTSPSCSPWPWGSSRSCAASTSTARPPAACLTNGT